MGKKLAFYQLLVGQAFFFGKNALEYLCTPLEPENMLLNSKTNRKQCLEIFFFNYLFSSILVDQKKRNFNNTKKERSCPKRQMFAFQTIFHLHPASDNLRLGNLLRKNFQKTLWAFWDEARKGFSVH